MIIDKRSDFPDPLGNIRKVIMALGNKGAVIQRMDYYPFGAQYSGLTEISYVSRKHPMSDKRLGTWSKRKK